MSTWTRTCIPSYLLTNERYVGDLLMRKYYTPPMLPLRAKKNRGEEDTFFKTNFTYKAQSAQSLKGGLCHGGRRM